MRCAIHVGIFFGSGKSTLRNIVPDVSNDASGSETAVVYARLRPASSSTRVVRAIRSGPRSIFGCWVSDSTHSKECQSGVKLGWVFNL